MSLIKRAPLLLLAVALLLFSLPLPGQAFTRVDLQTAAEHLRELNLARGVNPSGDMAIDANLTRAQLVTILVRAFGQEANSKYLNGAAAFTDTANHPWASGYIAMAKRIIEEQTGGKESVGMPDGSFNPEGQVTVAETVAFLMKFLGAPKDDTVSWPNNYLQGALNAGLITADDKALLDGIKNAPATRGLTFYLADRAFYGYKLAEGGTVYTKYVDSTPPTITLGTYLQEVEAASVKITGQLSEAGTLYAGNETVPVGADRLFAYTMPLEVGTNSVTFTAVDLAGNKSAPVTVTVTRKLIIQVPPVTIPNVQMTASLGSGMVPVNHEATLIVSFTADGKELATPPTYTVTVDPSLGAYNPETHVFKASRTPGKGTLVVEAPNGLKAEVAVTVFNDFHLVILPNNIFVKIGDEIQMTVKAQDYLGNEEPVGPVTWSVLLNRAKIDESGKLTIPDVRGMLVIMAASEGRTGTAYLRVGTGDIVIEAPVPARMKVGERVNIPIVVKQDGQVVTNIPVQVDTKVGTWDPVAQILTATTIPGRGNFLIYVGGFTQEWEIEVVSE